MRLLETSVDKSMKIKIPGLLRLVDLDPEDIERVLVYRWSKNRKRERVVIAANINGKTTSIGRFILGYEGPLEVDHKDHNPYNNKKENFRLATRSQQMANSKPQGDRKFKGVWWREDAQVWRASIKVNGKSIHLGHFYNEEEAARAYDKAAKKYFGEFAYLNFPEKV